jgi:hypothetical protein
MKKAAALTEVFAASGEQIVWKGQTIQALVSDNPTERSKATARWPPSPASVIPV